MSFVYHYTKFKKGLHSTIQETITNNDKFEENPTSAQNITSF